jgi:hypothetical protein
MILAGEMACSRAERRKNEVDFHGDLCQAQLASWRNNECHTTIVNDVVSLLKDTVNCSQPNQTLQNKTKKKRP